MASLASRRFALGSRVAGLLEAFRELGRSPRGLGAVAALAAGTLAAKTAAAAAAATALGVDDPLRAALLIVPAVELASILPLTPGNAGIASAAVAFALHAQGTTTDLAVTVGVAFGAVEILTALGVGILGGLALAAPRLRPQVRPVVLTASAATLAVALVVLTA